MSTCPRFFEPTFAGRQGLLQLSPGPTLHNRSRRHMRASQGAHGQSPSQCIIEKLAARGSYAP